MVGQLSVRSEINITPLVDVVLVLLIIFMVITPLMQSGYDVVTPKTESRAPGPQDQLVVSVFQNGAIYLNREPVTAISLGDRISKALRGHDARTAFFSADEGVGYGDAISVMDIMRAAGVKKIAVASAPSELGLK